MAEDKEQKNNSTDSATNRPTNRRQLRTRAAPIPSTRPYTSSVRKDDFVPLKYTWRVCKTPLVFSGTTKLHPLVFSVFHVSFFFVVGHKLDLK